MQYFGWEVMLQVLFSIAFDNPITNGLAFFSFFKKTSNRHCRKLTDALEYLKQVTLN